MPFSVLCAVSNDQFAVAQWRGTRFQATGVHSIITPLSEQMTLFLPTSENLPVSSAEKADDGGLLCWR